MIKRILMMGILVFICISISFAGDRTFEWDQNTETDLKSYTIYRSSSPNVPVIPANLYLKVWKPGENPNRFDPKNVEYTINANNKCELSRNILPDGKYYFVMTATDTGGNESGKSNEASTVIDDTAPAPPSGFRCTVESIQ